MYNYFRRLFSQIKGKLPLKKTKRNIFLEVMPCSKNCLLSTPVRLVGGLNRFKISNFFALEILFLQK